MKYRKGYKGATRPQTLDPSDYGKGSRKRIGPGTMPVGKHTCRFTRYAGAGKPYECPKCGNITGIDRDLI